jgi:hypothetical protein
VGAACTSRRVAPDSTRDGAEAKPLPNVAARPVPAPEGAPRPGMMWIAPGTLRAGTPRDRAPRVADEEPAGDPVEMGGFYIDRLPYPNEPGAIPTSNVTRDEAEALCSSKGKRLCTELEWERACKGPENTTYEYGDQYRASSCGTGVASEEAARRPTGENALCKSAFGVADMHGGVWEWTSSAWGRGATKEATLGVLRGGNAIAGELVGRCANAIGRPANKKSPTMGFRCCAGAKNAAEVTLPSKSAPTFEGRDPAPLRDAWDAELAKAAGASPVPFLRAWRWVPVANDELVVLVGCGRGDRATCGLVVGRQLEDKVMTLASLTVGLPQPEVVRLGDTKHLRLRGLDAPGTFGRDITYVYGRVEVAEPKRP